MAVSRGAVFCLGGLLSCAASGAARLDDAWIRAMPPTQSTTAAYLTVHNPGEDALVITGATAGISPRVEIHTVRTLDGMVRMERLEELRVEPGESVSLTPGGMHLMLLEVERMPAPGEAVPLCLQFAGGAEACTTATVKKSAGAADHRHH